MTAYFKDLQHNERCNEMHIETYFETISRRDMQHAPVQIRRSILVASWLDPCSSRFPEYLLDFRTMRNKENDKQTHIH